MPTLKETITFTALPNGRTPAKLRLSVFVSPRLSMEAPVDETLSFTLEDYPRWKDWPGAKPTFTVRFDEGAEVGTDVVSDPPSSDLWKMLFPATTSVRPHVFDKPLTDIISFNTYSVQAVHTKLQKIYTYFAKNFPESYPTVPDLLDADSPLKDLAGQFVPKKEVFKPTSIPADPVPALTLGEGGPTASISSTDDYEVFNKVQKFHAPFNPENRVTVTPPDVDFHQMLSALGRYPVLLRRLGLVYDLEVSPPSAATTVEVVAHWTGAPALPRLLTHCVIGATAFHAKPRDTAPDLSDDGLGMLRFDDPDEYELVQVNQDGAVLKTLRFAETFVRATFDPDAAEYQQFKPAAPGGWDPKAKMYKTADTPTAYALPAASTAGLAVARVDRAPEVKSALRTQQDKNSALEGSTAKVELDAEDLVRGYAIDVRDSDTGAWHSLCERVGTYAFSGTTLSGIVDEGWISMGITQPADGSNAAPKLQETLFNWWGWSLSAPRPGKTMDANGEPVAAESTPATQFDLKADFVAKPGSLPRLRYGTSYRLRARAVDLAGNRAARGAVTGTEHATAEVTYGRFEPVASPEVVLDDPLAEGDARDRVVIRSNYDTVIEKTARRHIAPPKAAEPTIEATGLFDAANGGFDASAYTLLQKKDGGSWTDIGKPDPNNVGVYYVKEQGKTLPYLPDVLSRGAVFRDLPGTSQPVRVGFAYESGQTWPEALPFDLVLHEGASAPQFKVGPRDLEVELGKADVASVMLSSYLDGSKGDVDRMALLRWMEMASDVSDAEVATFRQQVELGTHWMVTPFRTLTLVHAVRQPLVRPAFTAFGATRALQQTFAEVRDEHLQLSRKSTSRIDLLARWTETIDSVRDPGPVVVQGTARPFQFAVPLGPGLPTELDVYGNHEFNDTKYRRINYWADATSRFAEYFAERQSRVQVHAGIAVLLHTPVTDDGIDWGGVVEGSETVTASDRTTRYARGTDYVMDYAAGTLTPLPSLDGKAVNVTFIAPPIVRRTAGPQPLEIPSSARPNAPKVLYIIPTFGWDSTANQAGTQYTSQRKGGGLRVYMERPWFSSGDGELLGVVIWNGAWPPTEEIKPFVTDWGLDPMYQSAPTTARPTHSAFARSTTSRDKLTLEELPDVTAASDSIDVAGHAVGYDAERRLWYCDMEIDAGSSYTPFVRLALSRYQPISVDGAHLSRVVLADFVQLTANRSASLTRSSKQSDTLNVAVSGLSYQTLQSAPGPSTVEVSLEERRANTDPDAAGELGWDQVAGSTKELVPSAGPNGMTVWTGEITLPKGPPGHFRVVIREFERFGTTAAGRRLVYADAITV